MRLVMMLLLALMPAGCAAPSFAQEYNPWAVSAPVVRKTYTNFGQAGGGSLVRTSWYGGGERLNRHTASGAVFHPGGLSAAHRSLPLGTRLQVSYNGRSVVVVVNDRGPAAYTGRSLDLSRGAATALGFRAQGTAMVRIARLN